MDREPERLSEALAKLAAVLRRDVDHLTPDFVLIHFREQPEPWPLHFPAAAPAPLDEDDYAVLEAVRDVGGEPPAKAIAKLADRPFTPAFRSRLSALRSAGYLGGKPGAVGYPLTEKGAAALDGR